MKIDDLEQQAKAAIARWQDPQLPKPPGKPIVQCGCAKPIDPALIPFSFQFLGRNRKGLYVYNLDAEELLQYCDRYRAEFEV
jgi:hypothetical protein